MSTGSTAAPRLTITAAEVCRVARLRPENAADLADAQAVLEEDQAAIEGTLDPAAWTLGEEHRAVIGRAVVRLLAAEALEMRGREDGMSGTFVGAGFTVSRVPDHAANLRAEARRALAPYVRRTAILGAPGFAPSLGRRR